MTSSLPQPGSFGAWLLAARPKTLPAAVAPVLVGSACAWAADQFRRGPALAALFGALLLQLTANFANDAADFQRGADTEDRLGPVRTAQAGLLTLTDLKRATGATLVLSLVCGFYLLGVAGWPIFLLGLTAMVSAVAYTAGPFPLAYHGLGDLFVFLYFGLAAVIGTEYVQSLHFSWLALWAALPMGLLSGNILVVNNVRDVETDRRAGKRTLPARFGREFGVWQYGAQAVLAYAVPLLLVLGRVTSPWALLSWLTAPWAWSLWRRVAKERGVAMNATLAATAQLLSLFGALFALGISLAVFARP